MSDRDPESMALKLIREAALLLALITPLVLPARASEPFSPFEADIRELQAAMADGRTSSVELVDYYRSRIDAFDGAGPELNAIATVNPSARADAARLDAERANSGPRGPLHGIPVLVKDNYETRGMPTTAGSVALAGFAPEQDAELVRRLRAAGAVILGKTNMHEWAYGITTVGSGFGFTRNAYEPMRNPGGSSGGTGAAVAANFAAVGLGSDTCGSIRIPSAVHALVGLRGTQGASSRRGIVPLSSTQDIGGPLARSVSDLAEVLDVTVGYDPGDPQTAAVVGNLEGGFVSALRPGALRGKRIGLLTELIRTEPFDADMAELFDAAVADMRALGAEFAEVSLPDLDELVYAENGGFVVLARDFGVDIDAYLGAHADAPVTTLAELVARGDAHPAVQPLLEGSLAAVQAADQSLYYRELAKRERLRTAILDLMARNELDALAYPAIRIRPEPIGEPQPEDGVCQLSANSGLPALVFPIGFTADGLPASIELLGRPWSDPELLGLAFDYEQATRHRRPPPLL
ncbi:MAG: amidase family protein, partial [Pseudomonadales bacterium]|nr:amidase family protein [Pseudomonadales bacterium]